MSIKKQICRTILGLAIPILLLNSFNSSKVAAAPVPETNQVTTTNTNTQNNSTTNNSASNSTNSTTANSSSDGGDLFVDNITVTVSNPKAYSPTDTLPATKLLLMNTASGKIIKKNIAPTDMNNGQVSYRATVFPKLDYGQYQLCLDTGGATGTGCQNIDFTADKQVVSYQPTLDQAMFNQATDPSIRDPKTNLSEVNSQLCSEMFWGLRWILCPITKMLETGIYKIESNITKALFQYNSLKTYNDNGTKNPIYAVWEIMRNLSTTVVVLLLIYGLIMGSAGSKNYEVKHLMPRAVVALVLIWLSWFLLSFLVDFSNVIGTGLMHLPENILNQNGIGQNTTASEATLGAAGLIGALSFVTSKLVYFIFLAFEATPVILLGLIVALLGVLVILVIRQVLITALIVTAPIGIAFMILHGTEKAHEMWKENITKLLLMYPIVGFLIGMAKFISIVGDKTPGFFPKLAAYFAGLVPIVLIPYSFKYSGELLHSMSHIYKEYLEKGAHWAQHNHKFEEWKEHADQKKETAMMGDGVRMPILSARTGKTYFKKFKENHTTGKGSRGAVGTGLSVAARGGKPWLTQKQKTHMMSHAKESRVKMSKELDSLNLEKDGYLMIYGGKPWYDMLVQEQVMRYKMAEYEGDENSMANSKDKLVRVMSQWEIAKGYAGRGVAREAALVRIGAMGKIPNEFREELYVASGGRYYNNDEKPIDIDQIQKRRNKRNFLSLSQRHAYSVWEEAVGGNKDRDVEMALRRLDGALDYTDFVKNVKRVKPSELGSYNDRALYRLISVGGFEDIPTKTIENAEKNYGAGEFVDSLNRYRTITRNLTSVERFDQYFDRTLASTSADKLLHRIETAPLIHHKPAGKVFWVDEEKEPELARLVKENPEQIIRTQNHARKRTRDLMLKYGENDREAYSREIKKNPLGLLSDFEWMEYLELRSDFLQMVNEDGTQTYMNPVDGKKGSPVPNKRNINIHGSSHHSTTGGHHGGSSTSHH